MTATVRGTGSATGSTTTIAPVLPAGVVAGDLLLMFLEHRGETSAGASGWTPVLTHGFGATTAGTRLTVLRKTSDGADVTTTNSPGNHVHGAVMAIAAGTYDPTTPIHASVTGSLSATAGTVTIPSLTTTAGDVLVVMASAGSLPDALGGGQFTGWANANLTAVTERRDATTNVGDGGALSIVTGIKSSAGATGETSATAAAVAVRAYIVLGIAPAIFAPATGELQLRTNQHSGSYTYDALGRFNLVGNVATVEKITYTLYPTTGQAYLNGYASPVADVGPIDVTGSLGETALSGNTATVTIERTFAGALGEKQLEGFAATVTVDRNIFAATGETALVGFAPTATVQLEIIATPVTGELQLEGFAVPPAPQEFTVDADVGVARLEGVVADVESIAPIVLDEYRSSGGHGWQEDDDEAVLAIIREFINKRAA